VAEAAAAGPVDYLTAGTVWPSASKPRAHPVLGIAGLAAIVSAARAPVLAIGGVGVERFGEVARAGASGVSGIGLFIAAAAPDDRRCGAMALDEIVAAARRG